jgi:hypothetical protein
VEVDSAQRERASRLLIGEAGGLRLRRLKNELVGLPGEVVRASAFDKKGNGYAITDTRILLVSGDRVCVVERSKLTGLRQTADGEGSYSTFVQFEDWRGSSDECGLSGKAGFPELLAVCEAALVRSIFEDVAGGRTTGDVARTARQKRTLGTTSWSRASVRALIEERKFNRDSSALGVVAGGTWEKAQRLLAEEKGGRGFVRETLLPGVGAAVIPLLLLGGFGYMVVAGVLNALTPQGSTRSKPIWLGNSGSIGNGLRLSALAAKAPGGNELVTTIRVSDTGRRGVRLDSVTSRLLAEGGATDHWYPAVRGCGDTSFPTEQALPAGGDVEGTVCFRMPVSDPQSVMLVFERPSATGRKIVWFALKPEPPSSDGGGD